MEQRGAWLSRWFKMHPWYGDASETTGWSSPIWNEKTPQVPYDEWKYQVNEFRKWQQEWETLANSKDAGQPWYKVPNPPGEARHYPPGFLKPGLKAAVIFMSTTPTEDGFMWVKKGADTQSQYNVVKNYKAMEKVLARLVKNKKTLDMLIISGHAPHGCLTSKGYNPNPKTAGVRFGSGDDDFDQNMPPEIVKLIKQLLPEKKGLLVLAGCGAGNSESGLMKMSEVLERPVAGAINDCNCAGGFEHGKDDEGNIFEFLPADGLGGYADGGYRTSWDPKKK
jgi:hypothetical protein